MTTNYTKFLASKQRTQLDAGTPIDPDALHPTLLPFQRDIVSWAVRKGRAAIWTTTGTGKTLMQCEYARHSGATALIVAPLAVCQQTVREAATKLDLEVRYVRSGAEITGPGVWITNYELVDRFDPARLDVAVLDEGSILRDSTGKTRNLLIEHFASVPRRLTCTATPAPNEAEELTNQAEFVGAARRVDMLATYFIHDDNGWRPKGHARGPMFRWMAQWAIALRAPSDLGYDDAGFDLPGLSIVPEVVDADVEITDGALLPGALGGVGGRAKVRRQTLAARCERAAELVAAEPDEPWLLWAGLNDEADRLARLLPGAVNLHGSLSPEEKAEILLGFADGDIHTLITKPSIASRGLNFQRCARQVFVGLSDSYEDYFQCIRRSHRFGQTRPVRAHVVLSEPERAIAANVARKEQEANRMMAELVREMRHARTVEAAA